MVLNSKCGPMLPISTRCAACPSASIPASPKYRPRLIRQIQPAFNRPGIVAVQGIVVEEHPDGGSDTELAPLMFARQLHFQDFRSRAVRRLGQREIAPQRKLRAASGQPQHRLNDWTIADDEPAVRVTGAERGLYTIGNPSLRFGRLLVRRNGRALPERGPRSRRYRLQRSGVMPERGCARDEGEPGRYAPAMRRQIDHAALP